ncbi:ubiquitin-like-specific protease 1D isoform X2 [Populus nigra]|uniref:ubiquitin-like-specific protease 1D isoform X2 n=1 Tax=Populus nigra TaxID=3691 RepID=UPI002B2765E6|nr:ubiquitin-like-specific protease 1D isoform X2 [Populus nigra]
MGEEKSKKRPLDLDSNWDVIMGRDDGEPPPLVIVKNTPQPQPQPTPSQREDFASISDKKLEEQIERNKIHVMKLGPTLPDKGEKLQLTIKAMEEELDQRKHRRPAQMDVAECEKHRNSTASNGFGKKDASSQVKNSKSQFSTIFSRKMEENTDCRVGNAFDKELTTLVHCNRQNTRSNGRSWKKRKQNIQSSSRQLPFQCATSISLNGERRGPANGDQKGKASSAHLLHHNSENFSTNSSKKKDDCRVLPSNGSRPRKDPTVVVLDEDEPQLGTTELAKELAEHMKDAKISYPSRDDPASVEIAYKDMDCLAPEAFLTSPIMNFYIRYIRLQASPANKATCDYHFFNTFFYKKLEQAISYKGSDKESFFVKFRRWWKGVNIFEKAYILIPIHDDYLKEEWRYMNQEVPIDFPIPDRIWKHLDRRIEDKIIAVPQQKNDYDCGLFVLFFMERFIQEAPERLKKRDLAMFGKKWFRPEEASDLRKKIRAILMDEFQNAFKSGHISESSSLSSGGDPP